MGNYYKINSYISGIGYIKGYLAETKNGIISKVSYYISNIENDITPYYKLKLYDAG